MTGLNLQMTLTHLIAFNLTLLLAMASPGPALLYALRTTLSGGARQGMISGLGLGLMAALWTGAALLGLEAVFAVVPWAYLTLKIAGALYLIWIAVGMWRSARLPVRETPNASGRAFWGGVAINLANPKSVLFAASVLLVIFPPDITAVDKVLIVVNHLLVEWAVYAGFALLLSTKAARLTYLKAKPVIDRMAAGLLAALGLRLLLDR